MPYKQSWLDLEAASGGRTTIKGLVKEIRAMYNALEQSLMPRLPKPSENVESSDGEIEGIKYRLYWPKGTTEALPTGMWSKRQTEKITLFLA